MKPIPRILPLAGVAIAGVMAVNALAGAEGLPALLSGARAFAEEAAGAKSEPAKAADAEGKDAAASIPSPEAPKAAAVCAPTAAELAKEAGLSPAELQVLQSLGARRGQLDQREREMDTQLALLAAAEAKLDAKVKALNALKGDVQGLLTQVDAKEQAEIDRLVKVFEGMKAKDAAPRMVLLEDSVRLPIATKMKERALSAILAQMPAAEAKKLTEAMAERFAETKVKAAAAQAVAETPKAAQAKAADPKAAAPKAQAAAPSAAPPAKAG